MKINFERIKYSPFGKRIMNKFKVMLIIAVALFPLMLLLCALMFAGSWILGIIFIPITIGIPILIAYTSVRDVLFEARILSEMTDGEHNLLIMEYKKYEERNIIRYGHLTSYGMIMDGRILPWKNIRKIEFFPGEYHYVYRKHGGHTKYFPAKITVCSQFGKKLVSSTHSLDNEDYDLSDEIERFIESLPKYTKQRILIGNRYYYAK